MTTSPRPDTLQGIDAIRYLSSKGWPGFGLPNFGKKGYKDGWNAYGTGADERAAISHYNAGKIVSVFTDGQHVVLDRDFLWSDSLDKLGGLAHTAKIQRSNAPDRGALLYEVTDAEITSQNYKPEGSKEPYAEMIALARTGNHKAKAFAGIHNGGVYQLVDTHYGIKRVTRAELDTIWYILTGIHLDERRQRTERPQETHYAPADGDDLKQQVKAYWSAYSVFERFGLASEPERQGDEYKLHGNGGLYVGDPDNAAKRHKWYCHSDDVGGDQIHAWHYCRHGRVFSEGDKVAFRETLLEMANAAGIEIPTYTGGSGGGGGGVVDPDEVRAAVATLRDWVKSVSFAEYIPAELQSAVGYRTDSTDTRIADAYLDIADERGTWRFMVSNRTIAEKAGVSAGSVPAARRRLADWFLTFHDDGAISLSDVARRLISSSSYTLSEDILINLRATYSERKGDDPFLSGTSRTVKARIKRQAADLAAEGVTYKELLDATEPGMGESILRVLDALEVGGEMDRAELVDATGKTKSAIARATLRAERLGLLDTWQENKRAPKVYSLASDWQERIERLAPTLKTHKLGLERRKANLEALRAYLNRELKRREADEEKRGRLSRRLAKAEKHLAGVVAELHEGVDVERWVSTPNGKQAQRPHSMDRAHSDWMMEIKLVQQRQERENIKQIEVDLSGGYEHLAHYAMAAD